MPLPSLSSLLSYLPTVSLSPLLPLPSNLQQRLVSFLLRKTLGGIVKGGLDSDRIHADIRDGSFAIGNVDIDQQAIAPLLESLPTLSFVSGTISQISAKVSYPLAQLSLSLSDIDLVFRVRDQATAEEWLQQSTETLNAYNPSQDRNVEDDTMHESMISIAVAQDFIEHELSPDEDAELRASLHLSPSASSQSDFFLPGAFGGAPVKPGEEVVGEQEVEEVEKTMLAGLIERILARLNVKVGRVRIKLIWSEGDGGTAASTSRECENELEIRIDEIEYVGDTGGSEEGNTSGSTPQEQSVRAIKTTPPQVYLRLAPHPSPSSVESDSSDSSPSSSTDDLAQSVSFSNSTLPRPPHSTTLNTLSPDSSESDSDSGDDNDLLALSQSIADLRTSTASLPQSSRIGKGGGKGGTGLRSIDESGGSDMFSSATSFVSARSLSLRVESDPDPRELKHDDPFVNPDSAPPSQPSPTDSDEIPHTTPPQLIVSLGSPSTSYQLIFYLATKRSLHQDGTRSKAILQLTSNLDSGWIAALTTTQLSSLIHLSHRIIPPSGPVSSGSSPTTANSPLDLSILLKSLTLVLGYPESDSPDSESDSPDSESDFSPLWNSKDPSNVPATSLKTPHLRFKVENVGLDMRNGNLELIIKEITLSEVMSEIVGEKQGWRTLPILVSDNGLRGEGNKEIGGDWLVEGAGLGKDWRVQPPSSVGFGVGARRRASDIGEVAEERGVKQDAVKILLGKDGITEIQLSPIHLLLDLRLVSRLSPVLESLIEAVSTNDSASRDGASTPRSAAPRHQLSSLSRPRTPAYAFSQVHVPEDISTFPPSHKLDSTPIPSILFQCPLVRIDLRCPAPRKMRTEKEQESLIRSGIVVVELEGVYIAKRDEELEGKIKEIRAGIRPRGAPTLSRFLALSSLSPSDPAAVLPSLAYSPSFDSSPPILRCSIPLAHLKLKKATIDTLQLFADDLTQFLNTELSASTLFDESPAEREREKMIGSRYFGTKSFRGSERFGQGKGNGRDSEEETSRGTIEEGMVKINFDMSVTDFVVDLFIPTSPIDLSATPIDRHLRVLASDLAISVETLQDAADDLRAKVEVGDARIENLGTNGRQERQILLGRTVPGSLTETTRLPALKVNFATSADPQTDLKDSKIEVGVYGLTYFFECGHLDLAKDLGNFVKAPAGVFEQVVPNELTRLRLRLSNLSFHLTPPNLASRIVLSLAQVTVKSDLMPDSPRTNWAIDVRDAKVWAIESQFDLKDAEARSDIKDEDAWKAKGYVELAVLARASIIARQGNGLVLPDTELLVSDAKVQLALCADSIAALSAFSEDFISGLDLAKPTETSPEASGVPSRTISNTKRSTTDLLASVDANAFDSAPSIHDLPEFLSDDVPANLDYLAAGLSQRSKKSTRSRSQRCSDASQSERPGRVTENIDGETVRMFGSKGLQIEDDWLSESRCDSFDYSAPSSRVRLRLTNADISVHLHEGYDWYTTRKAIEEESKAVRRRLEKIRQLLASGQTPDATAENASVLMFGSHQLGLPPGADEMAPKDLLAAIDDELERGGQDYDAASTTASSWQTFPGGKNSTDIGNKKSTAATATVGRHRKRLTRSKAFAIEVNVRGLNTSFDSFSETPLSVQSSLTPLPRPGSRIKVDVSSFDIIDNIKTSTWRKFLTEMRPSDGGLVRATGSPMARIELETMKPVEQVDTAQDEINLKIKISPLRLYIDQDALDFLKNFGSFQKPSSAPPSGKSTSPNAPISQEPFYQRVEVFPVKIKLDYKPKRVDYYALKQGKTAELMNFFHFDGSEMVLRHLVVTGVSGTTTLSSLVQDIWTPDVKANQLADVISGIAPVRSVVNVGSGVANLVLLPIEQYRKDGRVVRGLQKGAQAFAKQTTLEAINVGAKLANGTQVILEQAEHVLGARFSQRITGETLDSPRPSTSSVGDTIIDFGDLSDEEIKKVRSRYAEQPADLRQGVESAYKSLGENFKEAAQTILAVPMEVYERSGNEGPVRAVVRAVPIAVLRPMIGASGAVSKALLGLRNTLDPDQQQGELEDKYKRRPNS